MMKLVQINIRRLWCIKKIWIHSNSWTIPWLWRVFHITLIVTTSLGQEQIVKALVIQVSTIKKDDIYYKRNSFLFLFLFLSRKKQFLGIQLTEVQSHFFLMCWIDDVVFYRNPLKLVTVFSFLGGEMLTWKLEQDRTKLAEGDLQGDVENFKYFPLETKNMDLDFLWTTCVLLNHCLW